MTEMHPGGESMTRRLLELSGLVPGRIPDTDGGAEPTGENEDSRICRILDMGAGEGHTIRLLTELGFEAVGIDLKLSAHGKTVPAHDETGIVTEREMLRRRLLFGDFLRCPFPDESFDAALSECAFYVSGDVRQALNEAFRLLRKGGLLLLADVCFVSEADWRYMLETAGFSVLHLEDQTALWREYYLSCIWNGTVDELCPCSLKGKCFYYLTICKKRADDACESGSSLI